MIALTSVIIPTARDPEIVIPCIQQLIKSTELPLEIICCVDAKQDTMNELLKLQVKNKNLVLTWNDSLTGASNAWNKGLSLSKGTYLVMGADDLVFTENWLEEAISVLLTISDGIGLVGLHDGHQWINPEGNSWCTHWLAHREFIIKHMGGVMAFGYPYGFNDTEAWYRATRVKRYAYANNSLVLHKHYDYGERAMDELDQRNRSKLAESQVIFNLREQAGFPNDFESVITE